MIARMLLSAVMLLCLVGSVSAMTLGVTVANGLVRSESQVQALAAYLESRLGEPVSWRVFASDAVLHDWLNRFRQVDLAVLDADYLQGQLPGEFFRLGRGLRPDGSATAMVVMRQGSDPTTLERAQQALLTMEQTADGKALLETLGLRQFVAAPRVLPSRNVKAAEKPRPLAPPPPAPVARKTQPAPVPAPVVRRSVAPAPRALPTPRRAVVAPVAARPRPRPQSPATVAAAAPAPVVAPLPSQTATKTLSLGLLPGNSLVRTEAEAGRLVAYLAAGLQMPVTVRVFADNNALQHWLAAQPGSELAVLDAARASQAEPRLQRLARIVRPGGQRQEALVIRGDADPQLQRRVQDLLLGMSGNPEGLKVLGEVGLDSFAAETDATAKAAPTLLPPQPQPQPLVAPVAAAAAPPAPVAASAPSRPTSAGVTVNAAALPAIGVQAERQGRWDDAIRLYQQILAGQPGQVELWLRIADIQAMLGRSHDAALSMLWMLDAIADDAALYHRLAQAHAVNGQFRAALAASKQALALAPGNDDYLRSHAQLAAWLGDSATVRESYLKILTRGWAD
jgi:ABC-type phosphate/phosphonate transport system substrate-binding protein